MASLRALNSARTWTFAGDLRSYLLCCFSFNQSSDKKPASKSETDAELAQYLDGIDTQPSPETAVGGIGSPADGEIKDNSQAGIPNAAEDSTDDARTSSLFAAADEIHPRQNISQTESELRDAEQSRFSSYDPTDLTKEASADSLPPGVDLSQTTDLEHG